MALIEALLPALSSVLDRVLPNPEQKAAAQLELMKLQQDGSLKELEASLSAINTEGASSDPWTSRARPGFLYVFYFILIMLVVVAPLLGLLRPDALGAFFANVTKGFAAIPEPLWWTFTTGYLGYTGARTYEKRIGVSK